MAPAGGPRGQPAPEHRGLRVPDVQARVSHSPADASQDRKGRLLRLQVTGAGGPRRVSGRRQPGQRVQFSRRRDLLLQRSEEHQAPARAQGDRRRRVRGLQESEKRHSRRRLRAGGDRVHGVLGLGVGVLCSTQVAAEDRQHGFRELSFAARSSAERGSSAVRLAVPAVDGCVGTESPGASKRNGRGNRR